MGRTADFTLGGVGSHWYWEFDGVDVDVDRLERAWNRLVDRHEMLRAVFDDDGQQRILPEVPRTRIPVIDGRAAGRRGARWPSCADACRTASPDPAAWPLFESARCATATRHRGSPSASTTSCWTR